MNAFCCRFLLAWSTLLLLALSGMDSRGVEPRKVGDINRDGELSVVDLTLLRRHVRGMEVLAQEHQPFADVNQDGVVNEDDARALIRLLTGEDSIRALPLTGIRETSPSNGEESVSSSRRTGIILRFSMPLDTSNQFHDRLVFGAFINGVRLNSRAELSSDGRKLVLFVTDKIPGNARVDVSLDTAGIKDLLGRELDGDGDGQPGGVFKFYYLTESLVVVPNTEIKGRVFASEKLNGQNVPLQGVIVRVAGTENAQVFTGADGSFTLPCPAGRFFAEVDGRKVLGETAFPDNAYYPYVVKAWEAVAGSKENLAVGTGEIFLPIIPAGALKEVDPNQETKVEAAASVVAANPAFAEISLSVPAGALRKEDGTSGGKIGMAPVAPSRLPEPLAPGLDFPLVITIQTDGAGTFDQPVAVKFPNLPDQNGNKLKAGEKTGLWSFNHDTGSWELQGPMTVTDDGNYVTTDPGVGVRQPGWHGVLPGSQGVGPKRAASAPALPEAVAKEVAQALSLAAQSSLPVRDAFLTLGGMRSSAEGLEEIARLLQDLRSLLAGYNEFNEVPYWWSADWLKLRIAKLRPGYERLFAGGTEDLFAALGRMQPPLDTVKRHLNALSSFNQLAYTDGSYTWLSTQFADSNSALLHVLNSIQPYLDALKAQAPFFNRTAFADVSKVLFPGFNEPALSRAQEMDALAKFLAQMQPVSAVVAIDHAEQLRNVKLQMSDYLAKAGALSIASGKLSKYGYIKVDAIGEPQRVRSNAAGDYRMVLPPDREFAVTYVDPKTLQVGAYVGISGWNGTVTDLYGPVLAPLQPNAVDPVELAYAKDTDGDKLADTLEIVIGTNVGTEEVAPVGPKTFADSDGDGTNDYREVTRGKNPLSGLAVGTGVIFSATTSQEGFESTDVDAGNELLLLSERRSDGGPQGGLMVYSLESKTEPLRQAFLQTEYPVYRVRYGDTNLAILSLHENGVAIVDLSSPTNPVVKATYPVSPGESVNSAILVGDILVLGLNDDNTGVARIVLKDVETGDTIREESAGGVISDLVANGTVVYALSKGNQSQNEQWPWALTSAVYTGDVNRARGPFAEGERLFRAVTLREWEFSKSGGRLALAPGKLFYVYESGLTVLDLAKPLAPVLEGDVFKPGAGFQLGWRHILFDGSRDASNKMTFLVALGSSGRGNADEDGDVAVFQYGRAKDFGLILDGQGDNTPVAQFVTQFDSRIDNPRQENLASGKVYCLALAGGIVYAADKEQGLKVVNYRKYDSEGRAPALSLGVNSPSPTTLDVSRVQEGGLLALTALPSDDVAVASVEWYVDGVRVAVTGGAPWGYTTRLPVLAGGPVRRLKVEARVYDTGGNMTSSERLLDVVEDPFPPAVLGVTPASSVKELSTVSVTFNEAMDQTSLTGSLTLLSAGTDGKLGTADDVPVEGGFLSEGYASVTLDFTEPLPEGLYRAVLSGSVADVAGNTLGAAYTWDFGVALVNSWRGGRGLWSDSAMWSSGAVPVAGESVRFPAGAQANVVVGGRASFRPSAESLVVGTSTFSRVLTKNAEGVVSVAGGANGASTTPIYVGMHVRGAMLGEGTYVKSVKVTEDPSDPSNQTQTTVFELSQPLVEGAAGGVLWTFVSGGSLDSVTVKGDTTLLDVDLELSGTLSLSSRLGFGGDSTLGVGTVLTEGSVALLSAAAVVDTGSLVAGRAHSGAARLKLTQPLLLSGSLALESAGFRDADGKLTTSRVQLSGGLDLAGHELRIFGGYAGSVGFNATPASPRYQFVAGDFTWTQAKADAEAKGGHLATAISKEEWDSISRTLGSAVMSKNLFIGGADPDLSGSWQWTTGEPWSFQNWASGQPDAGSERYVLVYGAESPGVWHNVAGDWPGRVDGYILEIEPPDTNSQSAVVAGAFNLRGPGRLAFEWKESLFDEEGADWDKFLLRVSAGELVLPEEVTLDVAGLGQVNFFASKLTNYGTVRIADQGWLKAYNYERVGTAAMELLGQDAKFDKMDLATGEGDESTWSFAHAVKEDGTLWAWGWNEAANGERGILGTGSSAQYVNEPEQVGADTDWKAVFDGSHSFFAIKTDGTLWAWGNNQYANGSNIGILGVGSLEVVVTKPQQVGVDDKWKTVRVGSNGTTGLKTDGSLWAWGDNSEGRLALPSSIPFADAPVRIGLDGDWKALFGNDALYAVKADGSLWTWGTYHDAYGVNDSGLGEERSRSAGVVPEPTRVGEDNGWQSVSGSFVGGHYAVKTDGTLWAWGHNTAGRLGVGVDVETVTVPTQVGEDRDWRAAFLSGDLAVWGRSFGLKSDGSLWSWGYSNEVSPGDHQHVRVPTLVPSDVPWVGLPHHGADGFIGVKSDGTLWRWEWNAPTCTRVGEDTDWAVLAGGGQPDALFLGRILKTDGSLWRFSGYYNQAGTDWVQDTEPVEIKVSIGWNR